MYDAMEKGDPPGPWSTRQMTLTLTILRCPDRVPPQTRTVSGGEFSIGRGSENDWVLPDPERVLSKRHCIFAYRSGGWQITDRSTNGTFLNRESEPIGDGMQRDLRDGDRLRLGPYELEAHITEAANSARRPVPERTLSRPLRLRISAPRARRSSKICFCGRGRSRIRLLPVSAPLLSICRPISTRSRQTTAEAPFTGPTQPDHSPHLEDAFVPASLVRWPAGRLGSRPASGLDPVAAERARYRAGPVQRPSRPRHPRPSPPRPYRPMSVPAELLAAFLRGTGLPERARADPTAAMEALGAAFAQLVSGLRLALIARARDQRRVPHRADDDPQPRQ